jgi:hypothetical protein
LVNLSATKVAKKLLAYNTSWTGRKKGGERPSVMIELRNQPVQEGVRFHVHRQHRAFCDIRTSMGIAISGVGDIMWIQQGAT